MPIEVVGSLELTALRQAKFAIRILRLVRRPIMICESSEIEVEASPRSVVVNARKTDGTWGLAVFNVNVDKSGPMSYRLPSNSQSAGPLDISSLIGRSQP